MKKINTEEYLEYALKFKDVEKKIRDSLMDWLPNELIDSHSHCNLSEHVLDISDKLMNQMITTFPYFSLNESIRIKSIVYPRKMIHSLRFPNPIKGIDHKRANEYLIENSGNQDKVALYGIPDDISYTTKMLGSKRFAALKMYRFYRDIPFEKIYDFFKPEILEVAQSLSIPIILHLPKMITDCLDDVERLIIDFPKLTIVIAHLGGPHILVPNLEEAYDSVSRHDNILMDTAMIPSKEVVDLAIRKFGIQRIMFGSDEPLNLVRATVYNNEILGQRLITEYPYHWVDMDEYAMYKYVLKNEVIHMHWNAINALSEAIKSLPRKKQDEAKELIFFKNAKDVFGFKI